MDPQGRVLESDIRIDPSGNLDEFLPRGHSGFAGEREADLAGCIVLPGLIQTHVHLCQTVMRGMAEGLRLGDWLRERIWPLEAAHDRRTLRASARLGLLELLSGGTTAILDMATTRNLEVVLEACQESGIRAISGSALMDSGDGVPDALRRDAGETIEETRRLALRFPLQDGDRVGVCLAPRFIPSVSKEAWRQVAAHAKEADLLIHTHACETEDEVSESRRTHKKSPFVYLDELGVASPRLRAAHGVWLGVEDREVVRRSGAAIIHCPGSNAKLGSGTADVVRLWEEGVPIGIGCDGGPCNNRLDAWEELRRAANAIALRHGPKAVDPVRILAMATRDGARLLRLDSRIGSLEVGKSADLVVLNPNAGAGLSPAGPDLHTRVLYGAGREHVEQVWIQGEKVADRGGVAAVPASEVLPEASEAARLLLKRAGGTWQSRTS